jgi:HEPN domain
MKGVYLEDLSFDAQQGAEKAIKAMFVQRGLTFPYVHDLARLLGLLERSGLKVPKYVKLASELTGFAVEPRYPGVVGTGHSQGTSTGGSHRRRRLALGCPAHRGRFAIIVDRVPPLDGRQQRVPCTNGVNRSLWTVYATVRNDLIKE